MHNKTKMKYWYLSFNRSFYSTFVLYPLRNHTRLVSTLDKHPVPLLQPCTHTQCISKHIHPNTTYNTVQYMHLHLIYNITHTSILNVQHHIIHVIHIVQNNEYTFYDTITTQYTYIVPHARNTTCMKYTQYHIYTSTICTTYTL